MSAVFPRHSGICRIPVKGQLCPVGFLAGVFLPGLVSIRRSHPSAGLAVLPVQAKDSQVTSGSVTQVPRAMVIGQVQGSVLREPASWWQWPPVSVPGDSVLHLFSLLPPFPASPQAGVGSLPSPPGAPHPPDICLNPCPELAPGLLPVPEEGPGHPTTASMAFCSPTAGLSLIGNGSS